jgi:hypothetical protein
LKEVQKGRKRTTHVIDGSLMGEALKSLEAARLHPEQGTGEVN